MMGRRQQGFALFWIGILQAGGAAHAAVTKAAAGHGLPGLVLEAIGILITISVLIYTLKCFLRPGEKGQRHIKRRILRDHW